MFLDAESTAVALHRFISTSNADKINKELPYFLSKPKVKKTINAYSDKLEDFGSQKIHSDWDLSKMLLFSKWLIITQSDKINKYIHFRNEIEIMLENGMYEQAKTKLNLVHEEIGESLWYIRMKLLLLYFSGNSSEMQSFCDEIKNRSNDGTIRFAVQFFILLTQSNDPRHTIELVLQRQLKELIAAGYADFANLSQEMLVPPHLKKPNLTSHMLELFQNFTIVDQYNLFTSTVIDFLISNEGEIHPEEMAEFLSFFISLSEHIDDHKLNNFLYRAADLENFNQNITLCAVETVPFDAIITAKGVYNKPVRNLIDIYNLSSGSTQSFDELIASITRLNGTEASIRLERELCKAVPNYIDLDRKKTFQEYANTILNPIQTPQDLLKLDHELKIQQEEVDNTDLNEVDFASLLGMKSPSKIGYAKKLIELKIEQLSKDDKHKEIISFASSILTKKEEVYLSFPLKEMINHIESVFLPSLDYLIVSHYYKKYISSNRSALHNELFEEFIIAHDISRPSQLIDNSHHDQSKLNFFFKEICSLETMDFLSDFQKSDELRAERLRLLEHINSNSTISKEDYYKETEELVNQIVLDSAASHFQTSKIYVDENSIKKKLSKEISTLYDLYRYADDERDEEKLLTIEGDDTTLSQALVSGGKSDILIKSIRLILEAFLYDENHGLDTNLSTEIRHGFFSNYIRSDLESRKLLTEVDKDGHYISNTYWRETYGSIISSQFLDILDEQFKSFSHDFNEIIKEAQGWMKVSVNLDEQKAMFVYHFDISQYEQLKDIIEYSDSPQEFMDEVFQLLWVDTEHILTCIRERIDVDLKQKVHNLFSELLQRLDSVKGDAVLNDLYSNINTSRNRTSEIISDIADWFNINKNRDFSQQNISQIIDVAINCIERIKGRQINISKHFEGGLNSLPLSGKIVKKLILSLIIVFENCLKHSGFDQRVSIAVNVNNYQNGFSIDIVNELSQDSLNSLDEARLKSINQMLISPHSLELMRAEGGTGLAKAYNNMKQVDANFELKVFCEGSRFITRVFNHEIDSCR